MAMNGGTVPKRKVMVVADPTRESAAALQYALSHAMMEKDELILIQVGNPNSWRSTFSTFLKRPTPPAAVAASSTERSRGGGDWDHLEAMKHACAFALPKVRVHIERVAMEGKGDKATTILHYCKLFSVDLLIVGQRRSLSTTILGDRSRRNGGPSRLAKATDTAEYLIENSKCTCVGVQKKGQNAGYLLNSKTQRNFWLLA
ncbi:hypothetical protein VitviT2T_006828 [Vitis vinifera]|uniref:UspA domain-containing protein n=2 Tax=Vitis vinifera TaxID=29760 RepID=A0ABY9BX74_VITVI|nr:uncharacterized protein LOC100247798 isoform X1 [Vitis vinifera]WJZ87450.1 hypothetical protein VitviT2T_006828 [Vitis vinifera]|eukprot:XP_010650171.1 PREDICTED: uncharacterized protein LOC100247798 isoform X1 [Vitis vinifera]